MEKISALMQLPIGIRIVAKDLTDSEQERLLDLMAGGKALLRFDKPQGSSKWVFTYVEDPEVDHDMVVQELASQFPLLLTAIRECLKFPVYLRANS